MTGILLVHGAGHGHQVRAVPLRGHDRPPGRMWHRIHHYVDDVREAAAGFPEPPVLVGHSLGGLVVRRHLERHPAKGAVLLAPIPHRGSLAAVAHLTARHPLVMGAEHDGFFTAGELRRTAAAYRAQAEIAGGMGHDLMLDQGWPRVADPHRPLGPGSPLPAAPVDMTDAESTPRSRRRRRRLQSGASALRGRDS